MASRTDIANLAASKLGEDDQMLDLDTEDSKIARSIRAVWDSVRDTVLRAHPWNFAQRRAELTAAEGFTPIGRFTHSFPLPTDCLRVGDVGINGSLTRDYELQGRALLFGEVGPIELRYTARTDVAGEWDALFVEAFAARLAWQVCDRITGDLQRKSACWQEYNLALREAKGVDGKENPPEPPMDSSWLTARVAGVAGAGEGSGW